MGFKVKGILATICINIFALMVVDVASEVNKMQEDLARLDYIFDTSVDMAVQNSMASEEFFSDSFQSQLGSYAISSPFTNSPLTANMTILRNNNWVKGNSYVMTMYYGANSSFPASQNAYNRFASGITTEDVYEYLFGTVGDDSGNAALAWADTYYEGTYVYNPSARVPNSDFKEYYDSIGSSITSTQFVKQRTPGGTWDMAEKELPVLSQMGLKLDAINDATAGTGETGANYSAVTHYGKFLSGSLERSQYYLTPYSLGVTYVPLDVLMVNTRANLENMIRFSKCKELGNGASDISGSELMDTYMSANGCLDTSYYVDNAGNTTVNPVDHTNTPVSWGSDTVRIMNDGAIEYDLSSLQVKVDYFNVDFYDSNNWEIVNTIEGAIPYETDLTTLPAKLAASDTSEVPKGNRIVARVSAKIRLHIPYKSSIMQWYIDEYAISPNEHYDIAQYDSATGNIVTDSDGVWYYYTTYAAVAR